MNYKNINNLKKIIGDKSFKKVFILTGKNSYYKSGASKIFEKILLNKTHKFYFKKSYYPEIEELKTINFNIKKFNPDLVIAVGGGSVIDYAKMANVLKFSLDIDKQIKKNSYKIKKKTFNLLAIPTTAGSGAEVTSNAVIYINKTKYSVENESLKPDEFIIMPELIIGASKKIKASAGFDAISQSIESLLSLKSTAQSVLYAKKSLKLSFKNYLNFVNNPSLNNTSQMALAANLSGKAISISKTTAPHALSYPFTAIYNISHGHAVSLTLNEFLKFNFENMFYSKSNFSLKERFKIIQKLAGTNSIFELIHYLKNIQKKAALETSFEKLGINIKKDYNRILSGVNPLRLNNNPIKIKTQDLHEILLNKKNEKKIIF